MTCKLCNYNGDFKKIFDVDGTKLPDAETYKGNDFHNEIRAGLNIHECPQCGTIRKFKRLTARPKRKKKYHRIEVTESFLKDNIALLRELRDSGITVAEAKKISNQIKRAEYYLKKDKKNA